MIDEKALEKLIANRQDELTKCVFNSSLSEKEQRPLLITKWKDSIDIEEPSLALLLLTRNIINAYESAREQPKGEITLSVHTLRQLGSDPKVQDAVLDPINPFSIAWHKREDEHRQAIAALQSPPHDTGIGKDDVELTHGMNCEGNIPNRQNDCTCGLKWRIMLQTEREMHNAWRKRAEEAELAIAAIPRIQPLSISEPCVQNSDENGHVQQDEHEKLLNTSEQETMKRCEIKGCHCHYIIPDRKEIEQIVDTIPTDPRRKKP